MDDESRVVSLRLWDVLDRVGVSERVRQLRRNTCIKAEIQQTLLDSMIGRPESMYFFGSYIEGTTTLFMGSDLDRVRCIDFHPVIDHIDQAPPGILHSLLSVSDYHTRPGYVKLQLVENGIQRNIHNSNSTVDNTRLGYDNTGRVCFKHCINQYRYHKTQRVGPADTLNIHGFIETDYVYAVRSRNFPPAAVQSLLECTRTDWLTREEVEEMIQYGCLYVGVGHPSSEEKEFEWRISFSLQERQLMFRLNPTQHKCYVLLKLIKNMLTSKPDIGKSITSYHCKTCLFRVINKTRLQQWTPQKLILCTFECLTELLQCLRNGSCPNFFIKTNNMFERRVHGEVKDGLIHYLSGMISEGFPLFYRIQTDNIGKALRGKNWFIDISQEMSQYAMTFPMDQSACAHILHMNMTIGEHMTRYTNEETTEYLIQQLDYLSSVNTITEHTQDETKAAIREFKPILHKLSAAHLASLAFSTNVHESKHRLLQASARHLKHAMTCDLMSGRLLYATILYRQGNIDMCCDLLERIVQSLHEPVMPICGCRRLSTAFAGYLPRLIFSCHRDSQSMMKSSVAVCMPFLPSHTEIIPTALQYELYRSVATPPRSRLSMDDAWFDLPVVDSKVYLYFMQYLVYSRLHRPADKRLATDNLLEQILEINLGHRETGYNLLGWIYSQEGHTEAAAKCFIQSWMIRPHHNAAKWHMLILIYRQYAARQ